MNQFDENDQKVIQLFEETGQISSSEANLRSKIQSLLNSLENLSQKKIRIEFEIRRQKKALARKREELKRTSKSLTAKGSIRLEASDLSRISSGAEKPLTLQYVDQVLLRESANVLEEE